MLNHGPRASERVFGSYTAPRDSHFGAPVRRRPAQGCTHAESRIDTEEECDAVPVTATSDTEYLVLHRDEFAELVEIAQSLTAAVVRLYGWVASKGHRLDAEGNAVESAEMESARIEAD